MEIVEDRETWHAAVPGVTKSRLDLVTEQKQWADRIFQLEVEVFAKAQGWEIALQRFNGCRDRFSLAR